MAKRGGRYTQRLYVGYSWLFKAFLIFGMIAVITLFIYFNQSVVRYLRQDASRVSEAYAHLIQYGASEATDPAVINFIFDNIITKVNIPIVVTDRSGTPSAWTVNISLSDTTQLAKKQLADFVKEFDSENAPIEITSGKEIVSILHYGDSYLIKRLQLMPVIEISVVGFFILVAFVGIRNIQQSEQRSIWVGMAKETAHQLGTPLSSLIGWVELIRLKYAEGKIIVQGDESGPNFDEMTVRMLSDLKRLDRIATRFGQIGSAPELEDNDLSEIIKEIVGYFRFRMPSGGIIIKEEYDQIPRININKELMSWVIENLIKNSLESTSPKTGVIQISTAFNKNLNKVLITVEDNGKGIPASDFKKIFAPGFTTKKRGWGLGLTLARRIVEEYHGGRIYVKYSEPNVKTAFGIELPV